MTVVDLTDLTRDIGRRLSFRTIMEGNPYDVDRQLNDMIKGGHRLLYIQRDNSDGGMFTANVVYIPEYYNA